MAAAQELTPKRTLAVGGAAVCSPVRGTAEAPAADERERARVLLAAGQQAALVGDRSFAVDLLGQAARLDRADADIAYHHARALEETGDGSGAIDEFCRYLSLAPGGPDAAEVRQRVGRLARTAGTGGAGVAAVVAEQFQNALVFFDREELRAAETALNYVIRHEPTLPEAYFNRALVYVRLERRVPATRDLESYLEYRPDAADRDAVLEQIAALQELRVSPSTALVRGLLVPGLGQYTTRRPALALAVAAGVAGAAYLALQTREETRTGTFPDPFENRPIEYERTVVVRPYLSAGLIAASAITVLAAAEAYAYASSQVRDAPGGAASRTAAPIIAPSADHLQLGLRLYLPRR